MPLFSDEELQQISESVNLLAIAVVSQGIEIPDEIRKDVLGTSIRHHHKHLDRLKIKQEAVDPYKIISWFAFDLAEKLPARTTNLRKLVRATITTLNYCLSREKPTGGLDTKTLSYLEDFVLNELVGDGKFGIGQNGLFVAFHTASVTKRRLAGYAAE